MRPFFTTIADYLFPVHRRPRRSTLRPRLEALEARELLYITLNADTWTPLGPAPVNAPGVELGYPTGRTQDLAPDPALPFFDPPGMKNVSCRAVSFYLGILRMPGKLTLVARTPVQFRAHPARGC
jgi:hypothetical protein